MEELIELKTYPVCSCGEVIKNLKISKIEILSSNPSNQIKNEIVFEPPYCPLCKKKFRSIHVYAPSLTFGPADFEKAYQKSTPDKEI